MSHKRGRKAKIYSQEEIDNIIYMYTQENKGNGLIKYLDVYRYSVQLFELNSIPYKLSEDFWRKLGRQGRETIDKANEIYEYSPLSNDETDTEKIMDTIDAIDKFFEGSKSKKEKLQGAMLINENNLKRYIQKKQLLIQQLNKQENTINDLKRKNKKLQERLDEYEELFFKWLDASSNKNVPLLNLVTTGKTRNPIVDKLFQSMFTDDPLKGYEEFEFYRKSYIQQAPQKENVYQLNQLSKKNNNNSLVDDLGL